MSLEDSLDVSSKALEEKAARPRKSSSTISNFIGKAKSKIFKKSENFSNNITLKSKIDIRTKPEEKPRTGPLAKVRNMVNNKTSAKPSTNGSATTIKRNAAKATATLASKKAQVMTIGRKARLFW